ncbi:MAG: sigma-70 family RNA polymerase sigma factor [Bacteroidota bacterium]
MAQPFVSSPPDVRPGDPGALDRLMEWAADRSLQIAKRLGTPDDSGLEPEDIAAEAVERLFTRYNDNLVPREPDPSLMDAYLRAIVTRVYTQQRMRAAQSTISPEVEWLSSDSSPETDILGTEVFDALYRAVERLPPATREVATLGLLQGLDTGDIAEHTGKSPATVRTYAKRALRALRRDRYLLEALGYEGSTEFSSTSVVSREENVALTEPVVAPVVVSGERTRGEVIRLARAVTRSDGFALFFAVGLEHSASRVLGALAFQVKRPIVEVDVADAPDDVTSLDGWLTEALESTEPAAGVFLRGLERYVLVERALDRPGVLSSVNWRRGALAALGRPLVVWVSESALTTIARYASDLFDWSSGVYSFSGDRVERDS